MRLTQTLCARQFKYFKRYVEKQMQKDYYSLQWHPIGGWKEKKRTDWYYGENRPWTSEFQQENLFRISKKKPTLVKPLKEWNVFKGDVVEVLVGKDKGKQGIVNSIIEERNWVYVEGLNLEYEITSVLGITACKVDEKPLYVTTQVKLVEPSDKKTTDIEWRYTEEGERVRVSTRTGRVLPLPDGADQFDDHVVPNRYIDNKEKDTIEKDLKEVTFKPKLCTFEEEILEKMGIKEDRKPARTFWY